MLVFLVINLYISLFIFHWFYSCSLCSPFTSTYCILGVGRMAVGGTGVLSTCRKFIAYVARQTCILIQ